MRLFDLHCDTLYECVKNETSIAQNSGQVDLERGRAFSPWYQCFAMWVRDGTPPADAAALTARMLQAAQQFEAEYPADFHILQQDAEFSFEPQTACTAILTVENGGAAAGGQELPDSWIAAGGKMISFTWNGANGWATGCEGNPAEGLTAAGRQALRKMEQNGIRPDAAHLNRRGFWELCELTSHPFAVSHTASAALQPLARNLTDRQFLAVRDRGGVVGVDFCGEHLGAQTVERFIAHLEHFLSLGGEKTVALGCDFDGITLPPAWQGMRILETLYDRLLQRNYAERLVEDIFFYNADRFFTNIKN